MLVIGLSVQNKLYAGEMTVKAEAAVFVTKEHAAAALVSDRQHDPHLK